MTKKHLKIAIEETSGFCFGVVNAIKMVEQKLENGQEIYCLGQIVHNEAEVQRLHSKGMKTIQKSDFQKIENQTVLFRAHGEPPESYKLAEQNKNRVVDATCPIVARLQQRIKNSYNQGENVFIFGKKEHPEVIGLDGQTGHNTFIFKDISELKNQKLPPKITLYSQTTMPTAKFREAVQFFQQKGIELQINDTICRQVSGRKDKLIAFSRRFDSVLFIGGKKSSNGRELFQICQAVNPQSYYVSHLREINPGWFAPSQSVGVCGATSTPKWQLEKVVDFLKKM